MNILGIETSCDETAAAVVKDGRVVLSSIIDNASLIRIIACLASPDKINLIGHLIKNRILFCLTIFLKSGFFLSPVISFINSSLLVISLFSIFDNNLVF